MSVFTPEQEKALIEKGISPQRAEFLLTKRYFNSTNVSSADKFSGYQSLGQEIPEIVDTRTPMGEFLGQLWNAVPTMGAGFINVIPITATGSYGDLFSSLVPSLGVINSNVSLFNKLTGKNVKTTPEPLDKAISNDAIFTKWIDGTNNFFDKWKVKPSAKGAAPLQVYNPQTKEWFEGANPYNIAAAAGQGIGSIAGFLGSIFITKKALGSSKGVSLGKLGSIDKESFIGSYAYMNNEVYKELKGKSDISDVDAARLSSLISVPVALSEYIGLQLLGKIISNPVKKSIIKESVADAVKANGGKITKDMFSDVAVKTAKGVNQRLGNALIKGGQGVITEGAEEYFQGKLQQAGEQLYDQIKGEEVFGTKLFSQQSIKDDINNTFWGGVIGGVVTTTGGFNSKVVEESMFKYIGDNVKRGKEKKIEGLKKYIVGLAKNGKLSPEQAKQGVELVDKMVKIHSEEMPVTLTDVNARYQAYDIINQRNETQKKLDELVKRPVDETLSEADRNLRTTLEETVKEYDNALSLIAKTKGEISEVELNNRLREIENQFVQKEAAVPETGTEEESEQLGQGVQEGVQVTKTVTPESLGGEELPESTQSGIKEEETPESVPEKVQLETDKKKYENRLKVMHMAEGKITKSTKLSDEQKNEKLAALEVDRQHANEQIKLINDRLGEIGKVEGGNVEVETATEGIAEENQGVGGEVEQVEPIRQLGSGANVYFETAKYRVNDNTKSGKIILNVGDQDGEIPLANIEFDTAEEAVFVAKKLEENAPYGLTAEHNIGNIIKNYKEEFKNKQNATKEREIQESNKQQYTQTDEGGATTETSDSDSNVDSEETEEISEDALLKEDISAALSELEAKRVKTRKVKQKAYGSKGGFIEKPVNVRLKDSTALADAIFNVVKNPTKENGNKLYEAFTAVYESPFTGSRQVKEVWEQLTETFPEIKEATKVSKIENFEKMQNRVSFTQSVMRDAMKIDMSKSVDENIKDLEQEGTIKTECD